MKQLHESTEGEDIIEYYLEDQGIKFQREVEINGLSNDTKSYRKADFYLPKYKIYVEFLGLWNNPERKQEYIEKIKTYESNKVPCIYIYPENLGILGEIFYMRMHQQFKKYPTLSHQSALFTLWKFNKIFWLSVTVCAVLFFALVLIENTFNGTLTISNNSIIFPIIVLAISLLYAVKLLLFKKKKLY